VPEGWCSDSCKFPVEFRPVQVEHLQQLRETEKQKLEKSKAADMGEGSSAPKARTVEMRDELYRVMVRCHYTLSCPAGARWYNSTYARSEQ